ncbi:DNA endonuclease [Pseudalkalibacillus caeni]|uniref:DNA endonuclease n=1 Tax=Exobacillus caeni TaxID=2574798 RepID=A0A5R9F6Z5_9BACL|nr:DNA endonuclease [Pseudalkalibacillus caeni]TLS36613.1 DNA endonuclease [Pseudalkalibacillus caeni]
MEFYSLNPDQQNILVASIIGDGEITKIYPNSRRKSNSYREHYGDNQREYREWKASFFPSILYLTPKSQTLRSKSTPLFTELYPHFYNSNGKKRVPVTMLNHCKSPYFLSILYMDDGSLSITRRINHREKRIYLTPHIFLHLQNYSLEQLQLLRDFILQTFHFNFSVNKRKDGYGYILRFTSTLNTYNFLKAINTCTTSCPSMFYKTNWEYRFEKERQKYNKIYPGYSVIATSSERFKNYTEQEIVKLINLKKFGMTDKEIASQIHRTYWSVVYKISELRKDGLL